MAEITQRNSPGSSTGWEYRVQTIGSFFGTKDEDIASTLNQWGEEGWEAINVYTPYGSDNVTIVAKRPLSRTNRRPRTLSE